MKTLETGAAGSFDELDGWSLELKERATEKAFAAHNWRSVARQARVGVLVAVAVALGFAYADLMLFGPGRRLVLFLAARLSLLLLGAPLLWLTRARERPPSFDLLLTLWAAWAALVIVALSSTRPSGYAPHGLVTMVAIVGAYQLIPLRFRSALFVGVALSAGYYVVLLTTQPFDRFHFVVIGMATVAANCFGIVGCRWQHRLRRTAFVAQRRAEQANESKSLFLAMISHELRTPLHGILGCAELLGGAALTPEEQRHLELLRQAGRGMLWLTDELLDLSRVEAGNLQMVPADLEPRRLVGEVAALARMRLRERGLAVDVEAAVPRWVRGDAARLRQVLSNLVDNAVKYGEGAVIVSLRERGGRLAFTVDSGGPALSAAQRDAIFEPFVRGPSPREGSGLGLAICKRLVEAMGGAIGVEAPASGGNRFWVALPLEPGTAPPEPRAELPPPPLSLLLVEDDAVSREVTAALLARDGHQLELAHDGEAAVEAVRARSFDAVLMDVRLPRLDGREAARRIHALPDAARAATPIIALTANLMRGEEAAYRAAGFDRVLTKPVDLAALAEALRFAARDRLVDDRVLFAHQAALSPATVSALAQLFLESGSATLSRLRAAAEANDTAAAAAQVHRLAGAARSLGLLRLGSAAARLESAARAGRTPVAGELDGIERLYQESARLLLDGHADAVAHAVNREDQPREY